ncbi:unnamed protein product [Lampetra planeri]
MHSHTASPLEGAHSRRGVTRRTHSLPGHACAACARPETHADILVREALRVTALACHALQHSAAQQGHRTRGATRRGVCSAHAVTLTSRLKVRAHGHGMPRPAGSLSKDNNHSAEAATRRRRVSWACTALSIKKRERAEEMHTGHYTSQLISNPCHNTN